MEPSIFPDIPLGWQEIIGYIDTNQLQNLSRHKNGEEVYKNNMKDINNKYNTIDDYIYDTIFGYPTFINNGKISVMKDINVSELPILRLNDYPYYFEENVCHYILWHTQEFSDSVIEKLLEEKLPYILNKPFVKKNYDYVYWVNPVNLKSVKNIWHAHVVIRFIK